MAKSSKISLSKEQAEEMYYNINSYFLFLQCAENIDKTMFGRLKFWNPTMNQHLRRARESVSTLLQDFQVHFKAKDVDIVKYDAPSELYEAMEYLSRLHPDKIREISGIEHKIVYTLIKGCRFAQVHQSFDRVYPIPLSEEILLKCGFKIRRDGKLYHDTLSLYEADFIFNSKSGIIKHLHQLQNLHYALTGEELEVKL